MDVAFPPTLINIILVVTGLSLGSFATALAHRVQAGQSVGIAKPLTRSACPQCNHVLGVVDLIPLLSWLSTSGRCRYCRQSIGMAYPMTELGVLLACFIVYWVKGWSPDTAFIIAALPFLAALLVIDLKHMILPNALVGTLAGIGLLRILFYGFFYGAAPNPGVMYEYGVNMFFLAGVSWLMGFVTEKLLKKEALGMGDVKFFAMAGLWLEISKAGWYFALSGFLGILFSVIFRNFIKSGQFPFGPALILAFFILILTEVSLF